MQAGRRGSEAGTDAVEAADLRLRLRLLLLKGWWRLAIRLGFEGARGRGGSRRQSHRRWLPWPAQRYAAAGRLLAVLRVNANCTGPGTRNRGALGQSSWEEHPTHNGPGEKPQRGGTAGGGKNRNSRLPSVDKSHDSSEHKNITAPPRDDIRRWSWDEFADMMSSYDLSG